MTKRPSGNPGGESSKRPPFGISVGSCCPIHLSGGSGGGDPRKVTTSDTSLPRTQALVCTLAARGGASLESGASRASTSAVTPTSVGVSTGARARDRVVATRVRDPSGSRVPPSQQRRSIPSTTALDQSSLEFSEESSFDQSEPEDVKKVVFGVVRFFRHFDIRTGTSTFRCRFI